MQGNKEEKEKCLEKLNHMQKYLPFLDFMIDKIKKKNNESSLKCQLSKFQVLRSMIAEKNGKYGWDEIIKIEDVIKKLISKLDFKGQTEKSKENLSNSDNQNRKTNIATSNTIAPSSVRTVSVTSPSSQTTAADFKLAESSTRTVGLIMKTLKVCAEKSMKKSTDRGKQLLPNSLGPNQPLDVSSKTMETDLDKDLDGFDLTDSESSNSVTEGVSAVPEKAPSHDDLLSSSREKLLKSLQCRLLPYKGDIASPKSSVISKSDKTSESQSISASSRNHTNLSDVKGGSDFSENSDYNAGDKKSRRAVDIPDGIPGKPIPIPTPIVPKSTKSFSLQEKIRSDSTASVGDANLKQRLKEKLSTDICEVYRVPGKSVGGSLRSLKESKGRKKSFTIEEDDLFKPDKIIEKGDSKRAGVPQSKPSAEKKDDQVPKSYHEALASGSEKKKDKSDKKAPQKCDATSVKQDGKTGNKKSDKNSKSTECKPAKNEPYKYEKTLGKEYKGSKERKKQSLKKEGEGRIPELDKLNDEELMKFVKENMQHLPHLSKLTPSEIRKAIQLSAKGLIAPQEVDSVSEISEESFLDLDEMTSSGGKAHGQAKPRKYSNSPRKVEELHPLASAKIAPTGADGVGKNVKPITEPSRDTKAPDEVGDKTKSDVSEDDNADEEDYAQRLIEETTPSVTHVKKKGLLQLPMPVVDDLFDEISSIESFETLSTPNDSGDPRLTLSRFSEKKITIKNKSESTHQPNAEQCKAGGGVRHSLTGHDNPQPPKDYSLSARVQTNTGPVTAPTESHRTQRTNQNRPDPWPSKSLASHNSQDVNQYPQLSNWYSIEPSDSAPRNAVTYSKPLANPAFSNSLTRHSYSSAEPQSYAEYKRLKLKGQEKSNQHEATAKENAKSTTPDNSSVSEISKSPAEREDTDRTTSKKCPDPRRTRDSYSKQTNAKSYHPSCGSDDRRRPLHAGQRRYSDHLDSRSREERKSYEETGKTVEDKRHSAESEELVSPLEELYSNECKPKTGRGYGIQHFKIPKKVRETVSQCPSKPNESQVHRVPVEEPKTQILNARREADCSKDSKEPILIHLDEVENQTSGSGAGDAVEEIGAERSKKSGEKWERSHISNAGVVPNKGTEKVESNKAVTKTESSMIDSDRTNHEGVDSHAKTSSIEAAEEISKAASESVVIPSNKSEGDDDSGKLENAESKVSSNPDKTEIARETLPDSEEDVTKSESKGGALETLKKCEAQIAECDSSMEYSGMCEQNAGKEATTPSDKSATVPKEEITQEFVEALIRKSFQSGEGKLLLAHAKLFEEFARKLNSKKLKTIQRIINSETDSSSSSTEVFSEDERRRKKGKKGEEKIQKNKKVRKRGRRGKRQKSSSSSCLSCESEESSEEEICDRKDDRNENKQREISATAAGDEGSKIQQQSASEESKSRNPDSVPAKANKRYKKRRRHVEFGKKFSGRKAKRKQQQKKLLEEILNETPNSEASQDPNALNPGDVPVKESEPKSKPKTKGKAKTELDRLHDDIRNMFFNAGVVTQTGQRMCRILRQSGGNINNLDIVKESAKMVEEEKLKKVHTLRSSARKPRVSRADSSDSRSRSRSLDKTSKTRESQQESEDGADPKLTQQPKVVLQRVDLNNFGYGVKVSEDCISFRRMRGRNTAIRGPRSRGVSKNEITLEASLVRNVFLPRNKRKVKRMREAKCKKEYVGKRLADVVKNLPLKMAKMKHLQICEKVEEQHEGTKRKKYWSGKSPKKSASRKNKSDLEFSNAELLNYAFERIRVMYSCKLCSQVTRYITGHYKAVHPDHEVLISRLCMGEAKRAKLDAKRNRYNSPVPEENPLAEAMKRKMKTLLNCSNSYNCRMCSSVKTQDLEVFKAHVSSHTGEFRFQCPAEGCNVRTYSFQDIKIHILTKHGKNRAEYNKVNELYTIVVEGGKMFGFLCSICHFVQLSRTNVMEHISRRHATSPNPGIIKINMSANLPKAVKKKLKNVKSEKDTLTNSENTANPEKLDEGSGEDSEVVSQKTISRESSAKAEETDEEECKEEDQNSEGEGAEAQKSEDDNGDSAVLTQKTCAIENAADSKAGVDEVGEEDEEDEEKDEAEEEEEEEEEMEKGEESVTKKSCSTASDQFSVNPLHEKETDVELTETASANDGEEDYADLKNASALEGSDFAESVESSQKKDGLARPSQETVGASQKLKVGPLEAQLLENSTVSYECYVKGCLFFTRAFDLFEKHIKISHCKTKWDGICEICNAGKDVQPNGDNSFKLLTALRHLRLHEREKVNDGNLSKEELIMELKLLNSSKECVTDDEEADKTEQDAESPVETKEEETPSKKKTENAESPYPPKPLLRVRNLLGDRLSTPKESPEENEVVAISEEPPPPEPQKNSMFTIENVRSLNDAPPEESEIQIQHVCSLKDSPKSLPPLASGKTILVRSCPTRKIAIRPEPSAVSIDVGQLSVVQAPPSSHPVVLGPLATTSPIRIISSSALSTKPKFTVKPILVSADAGRINTSNVLSIISPTLSPIVPNTAVTTETTKCITQSPVLPESSPASQILTSSKPTLDVTVIPAPSKSAPPAAPSTSLIDVEDAEEKDTITLQRIHSSPNVGNKRVKDAKIYEEMLTKTKLCHLFKCMGIECSFTCNNECVFRQHIGLHEAQRRLKKNKGIRTIFLRLANKTTRAFYWQQCAYCCELLTNTNNALSQHILEEHGHCMYQCAFCFYRAVSHSYVEIHQNLAHSQILKTTPRVIYKCKPLRTPPSQVAALVKHGRRQSVRPYHCDQCGRKFFITQDFIKHLTTQHQSVTAYTCHICKNLCFKADRLVVHYKLHSYCTYQCAYCLHGTETEKEMVFHLCNFHFSQPAIMYVRAFADGQKHLSNQLDSLKVIVYESDTLSADCIVEVDTDEEVPENASEANTDLSAIVAELGINTDVQSQSCVTPLMKELASIGDKNTKNLTVKTLLPNAQFSSENENGTENCSVLISSGLSTPSDQSNERAMNIPLGQLPLEVVNVQHNERTVNVSSRQLPAEVINVQHSEGKNISSPDRNLKLSEIIENFQNKDKAAAAAAAAAAALGSDELKQPAVISSAVHKLPPVVLSRGSASKNVYSSKSAMIKKKSEEAAPPNENTEGDDGEGSDQKSSSQTKERSGSPGKDAQDATPGESNVKAVNSSCGKAKASGASEKSEKNSAEPPLITSVVSLSSSEFEKEPAGSLNSSLVISDICSLSAKTDSTAQGIVVNIQAKANSPIALKPPIIRVEDFPIGEENKVSSTQENPISPVAEKKDGDKESEKPDTARSASPDIIILEEEKPDDVITVTLDSDDEKDENHKKEVDKDSRKEVEVPKSSLGGETIRKEMELLRNQIASETDSLLFDEAEGEKVKGDLSLSIEPGSEAPARQSLLSPIEEAICSLNKKLQSETEQAQKREENKKETAQESSSKVETSASEVPERPRTRFAARDKRKEGGESGEKGDGDESSSKKDVLGKCKKAKEDLVGKELFICGNENCNFAADDDFELKDHLYVCDLSRESSVLVCPHCSRQMKQFHPYLEHLKYHGQKKYHCGLCEYSSPVDANVTRHVKQKHKCSLLKVLPKDSQPGHLAYYPKNYKVDKVDFEVNGYSPGDEDKLPLQSVYQVNVKCAKCPYFTKVRSNMVRHLKIHVKSVETEGVVVVPSTAPTNPVPCLETKERMFDKMTNLAASSQLAQAKEKAVIESLSSEEAAKLPHFVAEQMRYKCCLPDCNYITVDDGMLKHHIKALHDEINYYSCPHCQDTVHVDVRHVTLDKIGHHLKHHDAKLYKCAHCIYFHYQKNMVEKHTAEKHPDRRYFVHTVREPKPEAASEEEAPSNETGPRVWKCGLCEGFRCPSKSTLMDHLLKTHNIKSKYRCKLCTMKGNSYQAFLNHFASKHPGEKVSFMRVYLSEKVPTGSLESGNSSGADSSSEHFDTTPLWQRGTPRIRHIRGILIEEEEIKTKKIKRTSLEESEAETSECVTVNENTFYCPLCTNKRKPFFTRSEDCFRTHLYQELNYQQFACILCGKMFVDRKDFDRHHARAHPDKTPAMKQTKEDHEIKFWVDQVIAKRRKQMEERKRKLSDGEASGNQGPPKKKKEV